MVRISKERAVRRGEILDIAERLFFQQGYEPTSVQEIIATLQIAKGTFYHHFRSKSELLDAVVERALQQTVAALEPVVADLELDALAKFSRVFTQLGSWKLANQRFWQELGATLYQDENVRLRARLWAGSARVLGPLLARIIRQGAAEGHFVSDDPGESAELVLRLVQALAESSVPLLLATEDRQTHLDAFAHRAAVYEHSLERMLGAPAGSLRIVDREQLTAWAG